MVLEPVSGLIVWVDVGQNGVVSVEPMEGGVLHLRRVPERSERC